MSKLYELGVVLAILSLPLSIGFIVGAYSERYHAITVIEKIEASCHTTQIQIPDFSSATDNEEVWM